jgi:hypothetical protein
MDKSKLVIIDVDGTILDSKMELSPNSIPAINQLTENNYLTAIATGRTLCELTDITNAIKGISFFIVSNGAAIYNSTKTEIIFENKMSAVIVKDVCEAAAQFEVYLEVYLDGKVIIEETKDKDLSYYRAGFLKKLSSTRTVVDNLNKFVRANQTKVEKINLFFHRKEDSAFMRTYCAEKGLDTTTSIYDGLEINNKGVSKGNAIQALSFEYHYEKKNLIAIGDSENDESMFDAAGYRIAMGNATQELQKKSRFYFINQ